MEEKIQTAKNLIAEADAIVIGAGAGLSSAAGLHYGGERFRQYFSDYMERYGLTDMYSSAFYPFTSLRKNGPIGPAISNSIAMGRACPSTKNSMNWSRIRRPLSLPPMWTASLLRLDLMRLPSLRSKGIMVNFSVLCPASRKSFPIKNWWWPCSKPVRISRFQVL